MPARPASGMARLVVDGTEVGSVYYEVDGGPGDGATGTAGILSGDPFALRRAFQEGHACLVPDHGRRFSIRVTDIADDRGSASMRLAEPAR